MSMNFLDTLIRKNTGELNVIQPRPKSLFESEQGPGAMPVVPNETLENSTSDDLAGKPSGPKMPLSSYHPAQENGNTVFENPEPETGSTDHAIRTSPEQNHGRSWDSSPKIQPNQAQDMAGKERVPASESTVLYPTRNVQAQPEHHEPAPVNPMQTNVKDPEPRVIEKTKTVVYAQPDTQSKPMDNTPDSPQPARIVREKKTETPQNSTGMVQQKSLNHTKPATPVGKGDTTVRKPASSAPFYPMVSRTSVDKEPRQAPIPPQVTISIGTIEIRATEKKTDRKTTGHIPAREPVLSLDDYLRQVNGDQK